MDLLKQRRRKRWGRIHRTGVGVVILFSFPQITLMLSAIKSLLNSVVEIRKSRPVAHQQVFIDPLTSANNPKINWSNYYTNFLWNTKHSITLNIKKTMCTVFFFFIFRGNTVQYILITLYNSLNNGIPEKTISYLLYLCKFIMHCITFFSNRFFIKLFL